MNLEKSYFCFENVIPHRFCDDLINFGENELNQGIARTGDSPKEELNENDLSKLYKVRNSSVSWIELEKEKWVWKMLNPYFHLANEQANWNFQLSFPENAQWTKYSKQQHYSWHEDAFPRPHNNPRHKSHGLIRKLSATISLEDGDKYEGGDLEFKIHEPNEEKIITLTSARGKGTVTIFPSFVFHRVTPVTKGTRYSLVIWHLGEPYV